MMVREPFLEVIILPPCASQQLPCTGLLPRLGARLLTATVLLLLSCGSCLIGAHAVEEQAVARAYRLGQENSVFVYRLLAADTAESRAYLLGIKKRCRTRLH
jgi:hypothetical protein